jgi:hypothetical protein
MPMLTGSMRGLKLYDRAQWIKSLHDCRGSEGGGLLHDQFEIDHEHQSVRGNADRVQVEILQLLLIHASHGCRLFKKTASLIADLNFEILVEGPHHGGTDAPDVIRILGSADLRVLKRDGALARHGNGGDGDVKGIAHADTAVEQVHRRAAAEASGDLKTLADSAQFRGFQIGILALHRLAAFHVAAAFLGEHLRGDHALQRGVADLEIGRKRLGSEGYQEHYETEHVTLISMRYLGLFLLTVCILLAQSSATKEEPDVKLPNGKSQKDEIIRVDYERNLRDAGELARLSEEIKDDLEKGDRYLVSTKTLKKLDDVEKLTKDIRQRLRRN